MFKRLLALFLILFIPFILIGCKNNKEIKFYNAGEYLNSDLKTKFYKETGIRIKEITYDSNEMALTSFKGGNKYDLAVLSDYAIDTLKNSQLNGEDIIEPIKWDKITSVTKDQYDSDLNFVNHLFEQNKKYNLLDYSIPYFWGDFGILYNKNKISEEEIKAKEWDILKTTHNSRGEKINVAIYDSAADLFTVALKQIGLTVAGASEESINKATAWLDSIPRANRNFITDEIFDDIPNKIYDVSPAYLGDAINIISRVSNEHANGKNKDLNLAYYTPQNSGSNVWFDGMVVPKNNSEQLALVYKFINFLFEEKNALLNANDLGYPSPIKSVLEKQKTDELEEDNPMPKEARDLLDVKISPKHELQIYDDKITYKILLDWVVFRCS